MHDKNCDAQNLSYSEKTTSYKTKNTSIKYVL